MALVEPSGTDNLAQETACCSWRCCCIFQWCTGAGDARMCHEVSRASVDFEGTTVAGFVQVHSVGSFPQHFGVLMSELVFARGSP